MPYEARSLRFEIHSTSLRKGSSEMRHAMAPEGKKAHLCPGESCDAPSSRNDAVMMYRSS